MNRFIDKIAVFSLCILAFIKGNDFAMPVVAFLCAIALSSINQCYPKTKLSLGCELVFCLLCFVSPVFCYAIPVLIYDVMWNKDYKVLVFPLLAIVANWRDFKTDTFLILLVSSFIAFLLWARTNRLEYFQQKFIETRDTSAEVTMLLMEKNKHLTESQDNEIYLATLQERNRIAREIHDNVGHMLTRTILQLGALKIINKDETVGENLDSIKQTLDNAMTSIRSSVHNLHDDSIDLDQSIRDTVKSMEESYDVKLDLDFSHNVPKNIKLCFIGVTKEALSNIVKHSNADKIEIIVREHPAFYQLAISDNGKNCGEIKDSGIGLTNMRDRVENTGGIITFTPSQDGFRVFASIPKGKK